MSVFFNAKEVAELGIEIEKNGEMFYSEALRSKPGTEVRCLLEWLAAEERVHKTIFEEMLRDLEKREKFHMNVDEEEYHTYLKDLADSHIFRKPEEVKNMLDRHAKGVELLDLALRFEKDSILLFQQMKKVTPPELGQKEIDRLITEEADHVKKISDLRRKMATTKPGR
jgi:rubrerythrin